MKLIQPYMFNAYLNWLIDNNQIPYLVINTHIPGVMYPTSSQQENNQFLVCNMSAASIRNLVVDDSGVSFNASFNRVPTSLYFPWKAIVSLQAKGAAQGLDFSGFPIDQSLSTDNIPAEPQSPESKKKTKLTLVSNNPTPTVSDKPKPNLTLV